MGRPLIYICSVTVIILGIIQININDRHTALAQRTASYANNAEMINLAHAGVEATLHELRDDPSWRNNYKPYSIILDYGTAEVVMEDHTTNASLGADQLQLNARGLMHGDSAAVNYKVAIVEAQIPDIPGALALTDPNFITNLYGSFDINGLDESGQDPEGLPGISVIDQASKDQIMESGTENQLDQVVGNTGTPSIEVDESLDFNTLSELIGQLEPNATYLNGQYTSNLGSKNNPGVFFVEDYAKITGNVNGYGILVVKKTGDLDLSTIDLAGTFNFYGLVLFENSWAFDGQGTATIHGSVVVGSSEGTPTTVDLGGNLNIQYNSAALDFAREAAKQNLPATFDILDIYE
ncbi:hypothetical protein [Fodinibius sediminis]|uniref:Type 4 fimbrial biogenesis protein PilX N-terminal domain-containing protein n=1 Tax=Fodinibius sediminis TaxID=1214077 RepID=A0A521EMV3_9BACT|nr:hypothetical protein [Fodinibius sediminis]SMO85249.1 hypothetical protein SAMN06265218_11765 [Fodinibius sediminis]